MWHRNRPANWHKKDIHHIIGKCNKWFNTNAKINKIIVDKTKHEALNTLVNDHQTPKQQLYILFTERRHPVLSPAIISKLLDILNTPDEEFYVQEVLKQKDNNKNKNNNNNA